MHECEVEFDLPSAVKIMGCTSLVDAITVAQMFVAFIEAVSSLDVGLKREPIALAYISELKAYIANESRESVLAATASTVPCDLAANQIQKPSQARSPENNFGAAALERPAPVGHGAAPADCGGKVFVEIPAESYAAIQNATEKLRQMNAELENATDKVLQMNAELENLRTAKQPIAGRKRFGSLVECLQSDEANIADQFEYAIKELSEPIESVLKPLLGRAGKSHNTELFFIGDVLKFIGRAAQACGGVTVKDAELFLRIKNRISPDLMRDADVEGLTERIAEIAGLIEEDDRYLPPTSLTALRQYDLAHGTQEAVKLASLFRSLVIEISALHPETLGKTLAVGAYVVVLSEFIPEEEKHDVASEEQRFTSSSGNESGSTSHSLEGDCRTLAISPHFTVEELRSAYMSKAKEWHPDRLEGMAPELKDYANRQFAQISAAYVRLKEKAAVGELVFAASEAPAQASEPRRSTQPTLGSAHASEDDQWHWEEPSQCPRSAAEHGSTDTRDHDGTAIAISGGAPAPQPKEVVPSDPDSGASKCRNCTGEDSAAAPHATVSAGTSVMRQSTPVPLNEQKRVNTPPNAESTGWRYTKVTLRTVWRTTKIIAAAALSVLAVWLVLLQLLMFLSNHWRGEASRGQAEARKGFETEKFFAFLNSVTWVPQQLWRTLMFLVSAVTLALIFAGQWVWALATQNLIATVLLACASVIALLTWVFTKERRAEFGCSGSDTPTTSSWVMGLVVLVSITSVSLWWNYAVRSSGLREYSMNRVPVSSTAESAAMPSTGVDVQRSQGSIPQQEKLTAEQSDSPSTPQAASAGARADFTMHWGSTELTRDWAALGVAAATAGKENEVLMVMFQFKEAGDAADQMMLTPEFVRTVTKMGFTKVMGIHVRPGTKATDNSSSSKPSTSLTVNPNDFAWFGDLGPDGVNWVKQPNVVMHRSVSPAVNNGSVSQPSRQNNELFLALRKTDAEMWTERAKGAGFNVQYTPCGQQTALCGDFRGEDALPYAKLIFGDKGLAEELARKGYAALMLRNMPKDQNNEQYFGMRPTPQGWSQLLQQ